MREVVVDGVLNSWEDYVDSLARKGEEEWKQAERRLHLPPAVTDTQDL